MSKLACPCCKHEIDYEQMFQCCLCGRHFHADEGEFFSTGLVCFECQDDQFKGEYEH